VGVAGQSSRSWKTCIRWPLCSCVRICGINLEQILQYCNLSTLFPTHWTWHSAPYKFPGCNPLFCADELIEALFISWADSCVGPSETWPVSHITVATAEMHHPLPHCAHIHCWVFINVEQASMNINGYNFLCMQEFDDTSLLCTHFNVRHHFARLLPCFLSHGNKT
jgi:hypothetical protein